MKSLKKNSIVLLIITLIVLIFVLKDDFFSIVDVLANTNLVFMFLAFACFFVGVLFQAMSYQSIIKEYNFDYSLFKAYKMLIITKFFNGITPFSSGGQPMQVLMLKKDGLRFTKATSIIIQNFIIYQAALVTLGAFAIIINYFNHMFTAIELLKQLVTVGFILNYFVMLLLILISFSKGFNKWLINFAIEMLDRFKFIKNKEEVLYKWEERVNDFHEGATFLKKNKKLCFQTYSYNLIALILIYVMPYFVIASINGGLLESINPFKAICASAYVLIMGSFIPVPGASGGIEFGYLQFFGNFIKGPILKASLLIWRTISYYVPMIIGGVLFSISTKRDDK